MRQVTKTLFDDTIVWRYNLPNEDTGIPQPSISTQKDACFSVITSEKLVNLIGMALIDYCFDPEEQDNRDFAHLLEIAIKARFKNTMESERESLLLRQGFFGETLLYAILLHHFGADTLICRGRLFDPLAKKESSGYDAFHLVEYDDRIDLWFGEAKFHSNYKTAITDVLKSMDHSLSDDYLQTNLIAITNSGKARGSQTAQILSDWESNAYRVNINTLIQNHNMKLIYPALLIYDDKAKEYDDIIKESVAEINTQLLQKSIKIPTFCSIFFILLPVSGARNIKLEVIKWIQQKRL